MTNVQVVTAAPPLAEKETPIHGQRGAGDEGGIIRTEEDHRVGDFVGGTKPAERYVRGDGRGAERGARGRGRPQKSFEQGCCGGSRRHLVDADAVLGGFGGRGAGERMRRALAGIVEAVPQVRQLRRDRTDIDNGAAVVAHRQDFVLEAEQQPFDVRIEYGVVVGLGIFGQRVDYIVPSTIGGAVQPTMTGHDLADDAHDLALDRYVELNECTVAADGAKHIERLASLFFTPSGYNDRRSLFTKRDGRGATDARRGASHKGNLPLKMSHIIDPFSACLACYAAERKHRRATGVLGFRSASPGGTTPGGCNWQLAHEAESTLSERGPPCRNGLEGYPLSPRCCLSWVGS